MASSRVRSFSLPSRRAWIAAAAALVATTVVLVSVIAWSRGTVAPACGQLQDRIDASAAGSTLDLTGCAYSGTFRIEKPLTVRGASIAAPSGGPGIVVTANDVTLERLRITGTQGTMWHVGEAGVTAEATAAHPVTRLTIRDSDISRLGGYGIYLAHVADVHLEDNEVHDIVYAGVMILSGMGGRIEGNTIRRIGVVGAEANENNAYGITLTRGVRDLATDPPTADFLVTENKVLDVPTWEAVSIHGGHRVTCVSNTIRGTPRAVVVTADGSGNGSSEIRITDNLLGSREVAVTTYKSRDITITGNQATGWPHGRLLEDYQGLSSDLIVADNTMMP